MSGHASWPPDDALLSDAPTGQLPIQPRRPPPRTGGSDAPAVEAVGRTHPGQVRAGNEDAFAVEDPASARARAHGTLLVVSDGMGGHAAGEVASKLAVETIQEAFYQQIGQPAGRPPGDALRDAIDAANARIYDAAQTTTEYAGMGCTVVALVLADDKLVVAHVGDSRAYQARDTRMRRLTRDHTWVAHQVDEGILTEEQAEHHPQRSMLMRALGRQPSVEIETSERTLKPGDVLLLCSDGLSGVVADDEIQEHILRLEPRAAADQLVRLANVRGAPDNVTVVVAAVRGDDPPAMAPPDDGMATLITARETPTERIPPTPGADDAVTPVPPPSRRPGAPAPRAGGTGARATSDEAGWEPGSQQPTSGIAGHQAAGHQAAGPGLATVGGAAQAFGMAGSADAQRLGTATAHLDPADVLVEPEHGLVEAYPPRPAAAARPTGPRTRSWLLVGAIMLFLIGLVILLLGLLSRATDGLPPLWSRPTPTAAVPTAAPTVAPGAVAPGADAPATTTPRPATTVPAPVSTGLPLPATPAPATATGATQAGPGGPIAGAATAAAAAVTAIVPQAPSATSGGGLPPAPTPTSSLPGVFPPVATVAGAIAAAPSAFATLTPTPSATPTPTTVAAEPTAAADSPAAQQPEPEQKPEEPVAQPQPAPARPAPRGRGILGPWLGGDDDDGCPGVLGQPGCGAVEEARRGVRDGVGIVRRYLPERSRAAAFLGRL